MSFIRLLCLGLMLAAVAPTVAHACTVLMTTPETLMRQGSIVVRVLVMQRDRVEEEDGYSATATVFVQESFVGPLPSRLIELRWSHYNGALCRSNAGVPPVGQTDLVMLYPVPEMENVYGVGGSVWFYADNTMEVLERFARLREDGDGVWVDLVAFRRLLRSQPELSVLRAAFPEVEIIPVDDAPPELQQLWPSIAELLEANPRPGLEFDEEDPRTAYRSDQSRFIARMHDGVVVGGEFR